MPRAVLTPRLCVQAAMEASELEDASWTAVPVKLKRQAPAVSPVSMGEQQSPRTESEPMVSDSPQKVQPQQHQDQHQQPPQQQKQHGQARPKQDRRARPARGMKQNENSYQQQPGMAEGLDRPVQQGRRPYQARRQHGIPARHGPQQQLHGQPAYQQAQQAAPPQPPHHHFAAAAAEQGGTTPVPIMFGSMDPAMHAPALAPSEEGMASTISGPPRRFFRGNARHRRGGQQQNSSQREAGPVAAAGPELSQAAQPESGAQPFRGPRGRGGRGGGRGPPRRRPPQQPQPAGV